MIIWLYGQQKSASSFCFQLISDVLEVMGCEQNERRREILSFVPDTIATGVKNMKTENISALFTAVESDPLPLAIKTHGTLTPQVDKYVWRNKLPLFATYRNPRDAALSLMEHGQRDLAAGKSGGFGAYATLDKAIEHMADSLPRILEWTSHPNTCAISYDTLKSRPDIAINRIARHLGIKDSMEALVQAYLDGQKKIENYNKGEAGRFEQVASASERALADRLFGEFELPAETEIEV